MPLVIGEEAEAATAMVMVTWPALYCVVKWGFGSSIVSTFQFAGLISRDLPIIY